MARRLYDHLELPVDVLTGTRRKTGGRGFPYGGIPGRDKAAFARAQLRQLDRLKTRFEARGAKLPPYINPDLVFRLKMTRAVPEGPFRKEMKERGLEVWAAGPGGASFWVAFPSRDSADAFQRRFEAYGQDRGEHVFNAIEAILPVTPRDRMGSGLQEQPFRATERGVVDVEVWQLEPERASALATSFERFLAERKAVVKDSLATDTFTLYRVELNRTTLDEVLEMPPVASVDRPPKMTFDVTTSDALHLGRRVISPAAEATTVLVLDSGIAARHPLLAPAVMDEFEAGQVETQRTLPLDLSDSTGHGTKVAGIAAYGDLEELSGEGEFQAPVWVVSCKVLYESPAGQPLAPPNELLERQVERAVRFAFDRFPRCRVVNISFGNALACMLPERRQFNLAALLDEMARELGILFVVSAGNYRREARDQYPRFFLEPNSKHTIIDPASAALALTVGALAVSPLRKSLQGTVGPVYPSPFTRVGPGYHGMIKPDLVELGGGGFGKDSQVLTLNHQWATDHRFFSYDEGTSYSAPKVANFAARVWNKYPLASASMVKALLVSSARLPEPRPGQLAEYSLKGPKAESRALLNIYGNGQPDLTHALNSEDARVVFVKETSIQANNIDVFNLIIPENFVETQGKRSISVSLAFDPPSNKNRADYLGVTLEARLFKNVSRDSIFTAFATEIPSEDDSSDDDHEQDDEDFEPLDDELPAKLRKAQVNLHPKVGLRKRGCIQKGTATWTRRPDIEPNERLSVAVISRRRWVSEDALQRYSLVVSIEHESMSTLYQELRDRNRATVPVSLGVATPASEPGRVGT